MQPAGLVCLGLWSLVRAEYELCERDGVSGRADACLTSVCCQKKTMAARTRVWSELWRLCDHSGTSRWPTCDLNCPTTSAANSGMLEKIAGCLPGPQVAETRPLRVRPLWELLLLPVRAWRSPFFSQYWPFSVGRRARRPNLNEPLQPVLTIRTSVKNIDGHD